MVTNCKDDTHTIDLFIVLSPLKRRFSRHVKHGMLKNALLEPCDGWAMRMGLTLSICLNRIILKFLYFT
jgi:ABC-type uncharacterized transport system permease subunit